MALFWTDFDRDLVVSNKYTIFAVQFESYEATGKCG